MTRLVEAPLTDEVNLDIGTGSFGGRTLVKPLETEIAIAYKEKSDKFRPSLLPTEAVVHGTKAMEFGANKYGVDQWKTVDMEPRAFIDALERHLIAYKQGEKLAQDSQVSHLGHIIANCAILLARYEKETR